MFENTLTGTVFCEWHDMCSKKNDLKRIIPYASGECRKNKTEISRLSWNGMPIYRNLFKEKYSEKDDENIK